MIKVYIAGPYTKGDVAANVRAAIDAGIAVGDLGACPYIPHMCHFMHLIHPREYEYWMALDMRWLEECDCIIRLPGEAEGADREVTAAIARGLPFFTSVKDFRQSVFWGCVT